MASTPRYRRPGSTLTRSQVLARQRARPFVIPGSKRDRELAAEGGRSTDPAAQAAAAGASRALMREAQRRGGAGDRSTPGTIGERAARSRAEFSSFDKTTRERALARFKRTHKWASESGNDDRARKVVAFLLSLEHEGYSGDKGLRRRRRSTAGVPGGPDRPPRGS